MGFLDNSGDIILDAVLTDAGRKRLARGDGTFKVTKYAFGDDEIDYNKYNPNATSGSAYFDLEILQTPILEAFTNNRASMKSKLISITNNNLLYLPELVLNQVANLAKTSGNSGRAQGLGSGSFYVSVNLSTTTALAGGGTGAVNTAVEFLDGSNINQQSPRYIRVDQGLNTNKLSAEVSLSPELTENQYLIQMDNRLGQLVDIGFNDTAGARAFGSPAFIDDDQIASYYVTRGVGGYIAKCMPGSLDSDLYSNVSNANFPGNADGAAETILGPRGTKLGFGIYAKETLRQSDYLFTTIGESDRNTGVVGQTDTFRIISSMIRVTGVTTGYSIDIPVTYVKCQSCA
jgi:hypothetical protein